MNLEKLLKEMKKSVIVITGEIGTAKSLVALKIIETLYPDQKLNECLKFDVTEAFELSNLRIVILPELEFLSKEDIKRIGYWFQVIMSNPESRTISYNVFKLNETEDRFIPISERYRKVIDFPSDKIIQEYCLIKAKLIHKKRIDDSINQIKQYYTNYDDLLTLKRNTNQSLLDLKVIQKKIKNSYSVEIFDQFIELIKALINSVIESAEKNKQIIEEILKRELEK